jgi:hypothetical protein
MFKIFMNNNLMDECRTYSQALTKAKKIKNLFCKTTYEVIVEDPQGRVMDRLK